MSSIKIAIILAIILAIIALYKTMSRKSPRDVAIDRAVAEVFDIKRKHHDRIVKALEEGASPAEHVSMLDQKRRDVIHAAEEVEREFGIVIDKSKPTEVGPVVVLER